MQMLRGMGAGVMRQRGSNRRSSPTSSSSRHNNNNRSLDSLDDINETLMVAGNCNNGSNHHNCNCSNDKPRGSPRSTLSLTLSGESVIIPTTTKDETRSRSFSTGTCRPSSILYGTLLLATLCCGAVNMSVGTLLILPRENENVAPVPTATKISTTVSKSNSLFGLLTFTQQRLVQHRASAPRVVHLYGDKSRPAVAIDHDSDNTNINREYAVEAAAATTTKDPCVPMADWQTQSFVTCNVLHEIDMGLGASETDTDASTTPAQSLKPLGEGWFRTTWKMDTATDTTVLKTLRVVRDFTPEFYELHRRDAVAMERLTSSKFVMDVYAYCGQSAVNEMADFAVPGIQNLEAFDRRMRGQNSRQGDMMKLRVAASIATGVADIHGVESMDGRPSMVHYDINPRNVAMCAGGRPKLNDFNIGEFLRWNPETNETCGFPSRMHEPWWRAPEEMNTTVKEDTVRLDEKVDIYALGNVLYHILTTHSPRGKMKRERMEIVRPAVAQGIAPELPEPYASGTDPIYAAFRDAMALCFAKDPKERGSAEEVANVLTNAVVAITAVHKEEDKKAASDEPATDENTDDGEEEGSEEEME
jgi:serine/threonine protein kinase